MPTDVAPPKAVLGGGLAANKAYQSLAVAIAVMFATFMEVLDTTVVNVSLPHIAGSLSATDRRGDVDADLLPGRERDHSADDRMARRTSSGASAC